MDAAYLSAFPTSGLKLAYIKLSVNGSPVFLGVELRSDVVPLTVDKVSEPPGGEEKRRECVWGGTGVL